MEPVFMDPLNFGWVIDDKLAGCAGPVSDNELAFLKKKGITSIVRLAEKYSAQVTSEQVVRSGLKDFHEPIRDFGAPSQEQIDRIVDHIKQSMANGERVAVCCDAGIGRTGLVLTCTLISLCSTLDQAINAMQAKRGKAWETSEQHEAILEFAKRKRKCVM